MGDVYVSLAPVAVGRFPGTGKRYGPVALRALDAAPDHTEVNFTGAFAAFFRHGSVLWLVVAVRVRQCNFSKADSQGDIVLKPRVPSPYFPGK